MARLECIPCLGLLLLGAGCFASSGLVDVCTQDRPECLGEWVPTCDGRDRCESLLWCAEELNCALPDVCPPITTTCTDGEIESPVPCSEGEACREVIHCDSRWYCRREACDAPAVCPGGYSEVDMCAADRVCSTLTDGCGGSVHCQADVVECGCRFDERRVMFCDVSLPGCRNGAGPECPSEDIYCESDTPSCVLPRCADDEVVVDGCAAGDPDCRQVSAPPGCGRLAPTFCLRVMDCLDPVYAPCRDATSNVLGQGAGVCPDFDSATPCQTVEWCRGTHFCMTACPWGGRQVVGPWACASQSNCHSVDHLRDDLPLFWCEDAGPACEAAPSCPDTHFEIPLATECPAPGECFYETVCSYTVHCAPAITDG